MALPPQVFPSIHSFRGSYSAVLSKRFFQHLLTLPKSSKFKQERNRLGQQRRTIMGMILILMGCLAGKTHVPLLPAATKAVGRCVPAAHGTRALEGRPELSHVHQRINRDSAEQVSLAREWNGRTGSDIGIFTVELVTHSCILLWYLCTVEGEPGPIYVNCLARKLVQSLHPTIKTKTGVNGASPTHERSRMLWFTLKLLHKTRNTNTNTPMPSIRTTGGPAGLASTSDSPWMPEEVPRSFQPHPRMHQKWVFQS